MKILERLFGYRGDYVSRSFSGGKGWLNLPTGVSIIGLAIGVGCMVVAMAAFSGFETTLRKSITDAQGHIHLYARGTRIENPEAVKSEILSVSKDIEAVTPFVTMEGAMSGDNGIAFVLLTGLDSKTYQKVLNLKSRLVAGKLTFASQEEIPGALIGMGLYKKFKIKIGDRIQVVLPNPSRLDSANFSPKVREFVVRGVIDFGKHEFNERFVFTDLSTAQEFGEWGQRIAGFRIRVKDATEAHKIADELGQKLGSPFVASDWKELYYNLFSAVEIEKPVIFFVMLIIIIAAAFNVATTLFITVLRRYRDMSLLKTFGAKKKDIVFIFVLHGLGVGTIGAGIGLIVGIIFCFGFTWIQDYVQLLPPDVYKLDKIILDVRFSDVALVLAATYIICFLSTLIPAMKGSQLPPVEGLRYE